MRKFKNWFMKNQKGLKMLSTFAFVFATLSANARCGFILHQPEMPEKVKKLRKL